MKKMKQLSFKGSLLFLLLLTVACSDQSEGMNEKIEKVSAEEQAQTSVESVEEDADIHPFFLKDYGIENIYRDLFYSIDTLEFVMHHNDYQFDVRYKWLGTEEYEGQTVDQVEYEVVFIGPDDSASVMENDFAEIWYDEEGNVVKLYSLYENPKEEKSEDRYFLYEGEYSLKLLENIFFFFDDLRRPELADGSRKTHEHTVEKENFHGYEIEMHDIRIGYEFEGELEEWGYYQVADFGDFEMMIKEELYSHEIENYFEVTAFKLKE